MRSPQRSLCDLPLSRRSCNARYGATHEYERVQPRSSSRGLEHQVLHGMFEVEAVPLPTFLHIQFLDCVYHGIEFANGPTCQGAFSGGVVFVWLPNFLWKSFENTKFFHGLGAWPRSPKS